MMEEPRCRNCRFYSAPGNKLGYCRINPPTPNPEDEEGSRHGEWPMVWADDWCGKHKRKEQVEYFESP